MSIVASSVLPLDRIRWIGAATCLALILANLFSSRCSGLSDLIVTRVFAGLGSGILVWITTSVIVRVAKPEQTAGTFLTIQTLAQAVLAALLALLVIPFGGWAWGFVAIAVCLLLPSLFITHLPAEQS